MESQISLYIIINFNNKKMKILHIITFILLIIGGLNWLLVGVFDLDLVAKIFGEMAVLSRIIYILVGLSAIIVLVTHKKSCKQCVSKQMPEM